MSYLELYTSQLNMFIGSQQSFEEAKYVIFGVPFDATSTYRTGARFGPVAIRQASLNVETYSFRSDVDVEDVAIHDAGDMHTNTNAEETVEMCRRVVQDILEAKKVPIAIGGEHTLTLGMVKGLGDLAKKTAVVSFDAHMDVRSEFMGATLSHTTFMQLIHEQVHPAKIIEVGTRAVCQEERAYAKKANIDFMPTLQILKEGTQKTLTDLKAKLEPFENVYVTVDMDVLDPAFAPAVQNPEPAGIDTNTLLDLICGLCDKRVVGFDVVEIAPMYDQGISAAAAAKVIFEMLAQLEKSALP
jgi:agmatinase